MILDNLLTGSFNIRFYALYRERKKHLSLSHSLLFVIATYMLRIFWYHN